MTSCHKFLPPFVAAVTVSLLLAACTDNKTEDRTQTKTVLPPVATMTPEKLAKLEKEAQAGDPDAQYSLAYLYENGIGVAKDKTKALELYKQAANQGHSAAQNNLKAAPP